MIEHSVPAPPGRRCRILVVEDEYLIADDLRRLLSGRGYEVIGPVADPETAWARAVGNAADFVVLDVDLNGEKSFGLATRLRAAAIPFLFLTGYDRNVIPAAFRDATCIQKPHEPASIIDAIRRHLDGGTGAGHESLIPPR